MKWKKTVLLELDKKLQRNLVSSGVHHTNAEKAKERKVACIVKVHAYNVHNT